MIFIKTIEEDVEIRFGTPNYGLNRPTKSKKQETTIIMKDEDVENLERPCWNKIKKPIVT